MSTLDYRRAYQQLRTTRAMKRLLDQGNLPSPTTGQVVGAFVDLYLEDLDEALIRSLGIVPEQLPQ